jgi:hypothetical protein
MRNRAESLAASALLPHKEEKGVTIFYIKTPYVQ